MVKDHTFSNFFLWRLFYGMALQKKYKFGLLLKIKGGRFQRTNLIWLLFELSWVKLRLYWGWVGVVKKLDNKAKVYREEGSELQKHYIFPSNLFFYFINFLLIAVDAGLKITNLKLAILSLGKFLVIWKVWSILVTKFPIKMGLGNWLLTFLLGRSKRSNFYSNLLRRRVDFRPKGIKR